MIERHLPPPAPAAERASASGAPSTRPAQPFVDPCSRPGQSPRRKHSEACIHLDMGRRVVVQTEVELSAAICRFRGDRARERHDPPERPELEDLEALTHLAGPLLERRLFVRWRSRAGAFRSTPMSLAAPPPTRPRSHLRRRSPLERSSRSGHCLPAQPDHPAPWDVSLHRMLESVRLVFVPLVNPGGMWLGTRPTRAGST